MKIGLLIIATGRYKLFFDDLYKTVEKNFLPEHEKTFFYFTDSKKDLTKQYPNMVQIYKKRLDLYILFCVYLDVNWREI